MSEHMTESLSDFARAILEDGLIAAEAVAKAASELGGSGIAADVSASAAVRGMFEAVARKGFIGTATLAP